MVLKEDYEIENDETVKIQLSDVTNATSGSTMNFVFTIIDNDFVKASFAWDAPIDMDEGDEQFKPFSIPVQLSAAPAKTVRVRYAIIEKSDGLDAADYELSGNVLTFASGDREEYITGKILGDKVYEEDEWMIIKLFPQDFVENGEILEQKIIIRNDDVPPPVISFSTTYGESDEENNAPIVINAVLDRPVDQPITVYFNTDGTAVQGSDYTVVNPVDQTILFPSGITERSINFFVNQDTEVEKDEDFIFTLETPQPAGIAVVDESKKYYKHVINSTSVE